VGSRIRPALGLGLLLLGALPASAQPASRSPAAGNPAAARIGLGALVGVAVTTDDNALNEPATVDLSVSGDVPLSSHWRLRAEVGRARWTFGGNEGLPEPLPPERIGLTRATVAAILQTDSLAGWYVGGGMGLYHWTAELSPVGFTFWEARNSRWGKAASRSDWRVKDKRSAVRRRHPGAH
jgi:hypothetical protein